MGIEFLQNMPSEAINEERENLEARKRAEDLFQSTDMVRLVKTYLEEDLPEELKRDQLMRQMWAILGKTPKLSFLVPDDIKEFESLYNQSEYFYLMSKPNHEITFKDLQNLQQLKFYNLINLRRSVGFQGHRFNERIILGGTINQTIRSNTEQFNTPSSGGGFMNKLKSWF